MICDGPRLAADDQITQVAVEGALVPQTRCALRRHDSHIRRPKAACWPGRRTTRGRTSRPRRLSVSRGFRRCGVSARHWPVPSAGIVRGAGRCLVISRRVAALV